MGGAQNRLILCLVALMLAMSAVSHAAERSPISTPTQPVPPVGGLPRAAPKLTAPECEGMGGKVVTNTGCPTGSGCITVDKTGIEHPQCIDNKVN